MVFAILLSLALQQTPQQLFDQLDATAKAIRAQYVSPAQVRSAFLAQILAGGGAITLPKNDTWAGSFVVPSNTRLDCNGSAITGSATGPALDILPGTHDVTVTNCVLTTTYDQQVVRIGRNDTTQTTLESVPQRITFSNITIPTYRGKRGFEVNGADVVLDHITVSDLYSPAGVDSQCVWVGNAPGPVTITNSTLSGATETIMVGGDVMKIPGVVPSDITVADSALGHPMAWFTDPTHHYVKNILELKTGHRVKVQRVTMDGSWRDAQSGYAFMITPRNGGDISDVLIEDVTITNVAGAFAFMGRTDVAPATPSPTQNIVVRRVNATASQVYCKGLGNFALLIGEVHDVSFDSINFVGDGGYFISTSVSNVWDLDTNASRASGPMESLSVTNSTFTAGTYGFFLNGFAYANPLQQGVRTLTVTGNTITGPSATITALKKNLPQNIYP